jgi:hypothetical protein
VAIGLPILALLVGASGPNETIILLGIIGSFVLAIFIIIFLLLDMVAELIRCQKLILDHLESQKVTPK